MDLPKERPKERPSELPKELSKALPKEPKEMPKTVHTGFFLGRLLRSPNDFTSRSLPFKIIVTSFSLKQPL